MIDLLVSTGLCWFFRKYAESLDPNYIIQPQIFVEHGLHLI